MKTIFYSRKFLICMAVFAVMFVLECVGQNPGNKPNIIFIAVDDLRPELGCYGNKVIKTPNIDRLAQKGMTFTNAYCQVGVCAPSRASMMTGLRPDSTQVWHLENKFRKTLPNAVTMPQYFKKFGYHTVSIGKIFHNFMPDSISFDEPDLRPAAYKTKEMIDRDPESFYFDGAIKKELAAVREKRIQKNPKMYADGWAYGRSVEVVNAPDDSLYDGAQTTLAIETLQKLKKRKEPFFLALGYYRPHLPFVAPKKYWDLYDRNNIPMASNPYIPQNVPIMALNAQKELNGCYDLDFVKHPLYFTMPDSIARILKHGYYASVSYVDACIGRLVDELERMNLLNNTIIVLWGDHGWKLGEHNSWGKHTNYLNDTHVPLIVYDPMVKKTAGGKSNELVELVDVFPTLCDIANIEIPAYMQGTSLKPLINNPVLRWKSAVFNQFQRKPGETLDKKQYMGYSMVTKKYHFIEWYNWDYAKKIATELVTTELYDLETDPEENINIALYPSNKTIVDALSTQRKKGWRGVNRELISKVE